MSGVKTIGRWVAKQEEEAQQWGIIEQAMYRNPDKIWWLEPFLETRVQGNLARSSQNPYSKRPEKLTRN